MQLCRVFADQWCKLISYGVMNILKTNMISTKITQSLAAFSLILQDNLCKSTLARIALFAHSQPDSVSMDSSFSCC